MCVTAISTAIAGAGLLTNLIGAGGQAASRRATTAASVRAEALREQQMQLETRRRMIESLRREQVARSMTNARATAQGVNLSSSVVAGAYGQQTGQLSRDLTMFRENSAIGAGLFQANADVARGQGQTALFEGLSRVGASMTASALPLGQIFGGSNQPGSSGFNQQGIGPFSTFVLPGNLDSGGGNYRYYP